MVRVKSINLFPQHLFLVFPCFSRMLFAFYCMNISYSIYINRIFENTFSKKKKSMRNEEHVC